MSFRGIQHLIKFMEVPCIKHTKKLLSLLLTLALGLVLASSLAVPAHAADSDFVIEDGVLKKYIGTSVDVVIPDSVTEIGSSAFA